MNPLHMNPASHYSPLLPPSPFLPLSVSTAPVLEMCVFWCVWFVDILLQPLLPDTPRPLLCEDSYASLSDLLDNTGS